MNVTKGLAAHAAYIDNACCGGYESVAARLAARGTEAPGLEGLKQQLEESI